MARQPRETSTKTVARSLSFLVLVLLAGAVWWTAQAVRTAIVPTASMEPTLRINDILTVRKDAYRNGAPQRGDIVLFRRKGDAEYFVKRVVGLPGETIVVASGQVMINGAWLDEAYVERQFIRERPLRRVLRNREYFVMGDNRSHSEDSRDFGPITEDEIWGLVTGVIYPMNRRQTLTNPFGAQPNTASAPRGVGPSMPEAV